MNTYEAYISGEIDLTAFGLERCGSDYTYFCTPVGADGFAAPGVDGIHYCMIKNFGEMVFAVSPMNCTGAYVLLPPGRGNRSLFQQAHSCALRPGQLLPGHRGRCSGLRSQGLCKPDPDLQRWRRRLRLRRQLRRRWRWRRRRRLRVV